MYLGTGKSVGILPKISGVITLWNLEWLVQYNIFFKNLKQE